MNHQQNNNEPEKKERPGDRAVTTLEKIVSCYAIPSWFGYSVSISDKNAIVGAMFGNIGMGIDSGYAYIY